MKWCFNIKNGIEIVNPSNNLAKAYIKKAKDSMEMAEMSIKAGKRDWAVTTMYYCNYFILYALLQKIGIKSGNHTCSILFAEKFLHEKIDKRNIKQLKKFKDERIEQQYYVSKGSVVGLNLRDIKNKTKKFFFNILEVINNITEEEIEAVRKKSIEYRNSCVKRVNK